MFNSVITDRTQINGMADCALHDVDLEGFQKAQNLHVFSLSRFAHSGLEQSVQGREDIWQIPALQRGSLIQGPDLLFYQGQEVERVKDHIRFGVRTLMLCDHFIAAANDDLMHKAAYVDFVMRIRHRHRVIIAAPPGIMFCITLPGNG